MIKILHVRDASEFPPIHSRNVAQYEAVVGPISEAVRNERDAGLIRYAREFDHLEALPLRHREEELESAAQAIAAMALGTETIARVDRVVGPGNVYVAAAKKLLSGEAGIDFVAGPTELLILAAHGDANVIAADMLAQAEHDVSASAILITTS